MLYSVGPDAIRITGPDLRTCTFRIRSTLAQTSDLSADRNAQSTQQRLINAAIPLIAEHGLQNLSFRVINKAAGARNQMAISYHFGSMEGLLQAGLLQALQPYVAALGARLDALLERHPADAVPVAELAAAMLDPMMAMAARPSGLIELKFVSRVASSAGEYGLPLITRELTPATHRLIALLAASRPDVPAASLGLRVVFGFNTLLQTLAHWDSPQLWPASVQSVEQLAPALHDYLVGGLSGPLPAP